MGLVRMVKPFQTNQVFSHLQEVKLLSQLKMFTYFCEIENVKIQT